VSAAATVSEIEAGPATPAENGGNTARAILEGSEGELEIPCPAHTTERRLVWRIDFHILPFLCIMYLMSFLDRVNIGNARSFNLEQDLKIGGTEFNTALTIFFVPFILFEIPSNLMFKFLGPNRWVPICMFAFGFVMMCQGLVQSYGGLLATRFFLGLFECGMFPGSFYLLGKFCLRDWMETSVLN
jgi:MFS family permease